MASYQDKARERIKAGVGRIRSMCKAGLRRNANEADTRTIVLAVLTDLLGWDAVEDVTQEQMTGRGFCDFLVMREGEPYVIIEVKPVTMALNADHERQVQNYAQTEGLDWVAVTNGDRWKIFRLVYDSRKGANPKPRLDLIFDTSFTDTKKVKPGDRIDALYLLSKEAARADELRAFHDGREALEPQELVKRLLRKDVVDRVRVGLKNDTGLKITNEELAERIVSVVVRDEAKPKNLRYWIGRSGQ